MKYTTYQFYTYSGERLAIFWDGQYIHVIKCNKNDQFNKKKQKNCLKTQMQKDMNLSR